MECLQYTISSFVRRGTLCYRTKLTKGSGWECILNKQTNNKSISISLLPSRQFKWQAAIGLELDHTSTNSIMGYWLGVLRGPNLLIWKRSLLPYKKAYYKEKGPDLNEEPCEYMWPYIYKSWEICFRPTYVNQTCQHLIVVCGKNMLVCFNNNNNNKTADGIPADGCLVPMERRCGHNRFGSLLYGTPSSWWAPSVHYLVCVDSVIINALPLTKNIIYKFVFLYREIIIITKTNPVSKYLISKVIFFSFKM